MAIAKYDFDPKTKKIVALNDEAREVLAKMEAARPKEWDVNEARKLDEASLGPDWVTVPVRSERERALARSFVDFGLTEAEAALAASFSYEAV